MCKRNGPVAASVAVAVVGGRRSPTIPDVVGAEVRHFPSSGYGGNGRHQSALAAIRGGGFALVLIVVRWMGHADSDGVRRACRNSGVRFRVVTGGMGSVARELRALVTQEVSDVR